MSELLIVPPLTDHTVEIEVPPDTEVLDLNDHLVRRLSDPGALETAAGRLDVPGASREQALDALFARAAVDALRRGAHDRTTLRATALGMRLAEDPGDAVALAVDDLELRHGSTESAADAGEAARRTRVFDPETAVALERAAGRPVRIVLETDQQVPAALALARALGPARTTLAGPFACRFGNVLRRLPGLSAAHTAPAPVAKRVRAPWLPAGRTGPLRWAAGPGAANARTPWAGWFDAAEAEAVSAEAWETCAGLTLTVARLGSWESALGSHGDPVDLTAVLDRLPPGTPLALELLVGAPGTDEGAVADAVALIAATGGRVVLAGLRPFRLERPTARWHDVPLALRPEDGHDLARWTPFEAPGTLSPVERAPAVARLLAGPCAGFDLHPGRLAAAVVTAGHGTDHVGGDKGGRTGAGRAAVPGPPTPWRDAWSPCARIATTWHADVDGRGPGTFVADLRTGRAFRVHPRLEPFVSALAVGDGRPLARLSPDTRTRLTDRLVSVGALRRTP